MKAFFKPITTVIFFSFLMTSAAYALAPVESLVLGNFSDIYIENKTDPLNYVFSKDSNQKTDVPIQYKKELILYRGFYEEGKNAANYCKDQHTIKYVSDWEKIQVKRSNMSLIQYVGLDLITRALPLYAKNLEYTREEYANMVEGLVGNFCSANISVISKRELLNNFYLKFDKENNFKLPSVANNPYFPNDLEKYLPGKKAMEQEMLYTVKLFQSLCSWTGDPGNSGLMAGILKHAGLMAFFNRQMSNQSIGWNELNNGLFLKEDPNTAQVWCENLICRRVPRGEFLSRFIFSIGGTSISEDLKRLYCEEFRLADYNPKDSDPRLAKIMNSRSFDEENFINSQFIALITGIPDFLLRAENFKEGQELLRASVDFTWGKWAKNMSDNFTRELFFEEPLTLELVERDQYEDFRSSKLKVAFDVNLGEFDRINQRMGKVKVGFVIRVQNSFLQYYRQALKTTDYKDLQEQLRLKNRFKQQLAKDIQASREKFIIPPWKGDLEGLIANEITSQIMARPEKFLDFSGKGNKEIEVEVNYGLFALKYINHQQNVLKAHVFDRAE